MNSDIRKEVIALGQTYFFTIQFVNAKYSKPLKIKRLGQNGFFTICGKLYTCCKNDTFIFVKIRAESKNNKKAQTLETTEFKPFSLLRHGGIEPPTP